MINCCNYIKKDSYNIPTYTYLFIEKPLVLSVMEYKNTFNLHAKEKLLYFKMFDYNFIIFDIICLVAINKLELLHCSSFDYN